MTYLRASSYGEALTPNPSYDNIHESLYTRTLYVTLDYKGTSRGEIMNERLTSPLIIVKSRDYSITSGLEAKTKASRRCEKVQNRGHVTSMHSLLDPLPVRSLRSQHGQVAWF